MTSTELDLFLAESEQAVLATLRSDGSPFATPVAFDWDGEYFYVTLDADRAGVRRMRKDPRISITVPSSSIYPTKFVIAEGIAEEQSDPEYEISRRILFHGQAGKWEDRRVDAERFFESWVSAGRIVFRLEVTNLITFDGKKMTRAEKYTTAGGMPKIDGRSS